MASCSWPQLSSWSPQSTPRGVGHAWPPCVAVFVLHHCNALSSRKRADSASTPRSMTGFVWKIQTWRNNAKEVLQMQKVQWQVGCKANRATRTNHQPKSIETIQPEPVVHVWHHPKECRNCVQTGIPLHLWQASACLFNNSTLASSNQQYSVPHGGISVLRVIVAQCKRTTWCSLEFTHVPRSVLTQ